MFKEEWYMEEEVEEYILGSDDEEKSEELYDTQVALTSETDKISEESYDTQIFNTSETATIMKQTPDK